MTTCRLYFVWFMSLVIAVSVRTSAQDQNAIPGDSTPEIKLPSPSEIEQEIAALKALPQGQAPDPEPAIALYRQALEHLQRQDDAATRLAESRRLTQAAPELLESIRAELAAPPAEPDLDLPENPTLNQLEQGLTKAQAALVAAKAAADALAEESTRRDHRRPEIINQLSDLRKQLADTQDAIKVLTPGDPTPLAKAKRIALLAKRAHLLIEIQAVEAESASYDARVDLLAARRDLALRRVSQAQSTVEAWQALVTKARQAQAEQAAREAEKLSRDAARKHPVLTSFASENTRLANLRVGDHGTTARLAKLTKTLEAARTTLEKIRDGYQSVQRRIRATNLNRATGLLLRLQYAELPDTATLRNQLRKTRKDLEETELRRIDLQEQREGAGDINRIVENLLEKINAQPEKINADQNALEKAARELAMNRRDILDSLLTDAGKQSQKLFELSQAQQNLLEATREYQAYIEERILWIRSISAGQGSLFKGLPEAAAWLVDPESWKNAANLALQDIRTHPSLTAFAGFLLALTFLIVRFSRRKLDQIAALVSNYRTDSLKLTSTALLCTIGASLFLPSVFIVAAWFLQRSPSQVPVAAALANALVENIPLVIILIFARSAMRSHGLFGAHFRWHDQAVAHVRRQIRWYLPIAVPLSLCSAAFEAHANEDFITSMGRLAFVLHMIALAVFVQRLMRPNGPAMRAYLNHSKSKILGNLRYFWFNLAVALPILLAILSRLGYHYTAIRLYTQVQQSIFLVVALILFYALMQRWLFVARRTVAIQNAKRKREKAQANLAQLSDSQPPPADDEILDLPAMSAQTQQIFSAVIFVSVIVGFFSIWSPVLPALRMLDRVEVWPQLRLVTEVQDAGVPVLERNQGSIESSALNTINQQARTGDPSSNLQAPPNRSSRNDSLSNPAETLNAAAGINDNQPNQSDAATQVVVTLADIGIALVVLFATVLAFRNLPGLVEILILHRLPLDAGSRYALTTVLRYIIAIIGMSIAFSAIGLSWNKVQWLAAALTFGLAFGLQEIFANFISGLIILAERPIRIGDTVTVGGITGDVSRIRMRATTITDWDRKELVIPNKTFITGEVINWTLTDPILRIIIPVGVSYGSDVDQVERVLYQVAAADPIVLTTPETKVLFMSFADSTLNFELRVFVPSIHHIFTGRHSLHMLITKAFRDEGIEIAFPQRDLHLRTSEAPITIVRRSDDDAGSNGK
jgi:potassium-dependent mechanosensitive channel